MRKKLLLSAILFVAVFFTNSYGQWSSNPAVNLPICTETGEQVLPKVAVTSDGGCYITWFDSRNGSYAVYVQKLNQFGGKLFGENGLLVSNNPQSTSLVGYDMIVDDSSNCIVAFTDTRLGGQITPFVYKISPTGTMLWGANGISLNSVSTVYQANPKLAKLSDNSIWVTWIYTSTPRVAKYQRITPGGVKQFAADGLAVSAAETIDFPSAIGSDNGSVIMMFIGYTGSFINPANYKIYTQKFSSTGGSVWNANFDTVYALGAGSGFNPPFIYSDGNNGAIYSWNDARPGTSMTSYIQRINSAGTKLFPVNGSACNTTAGRVRNTQQACFMTSTNETYVFWKEANSGQTQMGLYGQRFSPTGDRLWTDAGKEIMPLAALSFSTLSTAASDSTVCLYINQSVDGANTIITAQKYNRAGATQWMTPFLNVGTATSSKGNIEGKINYNGMSIVTWQSSDIFAQNINKNGTLGGPVSVNQISSEIPAGFELKQNFPNPFNPATKINFSLKTASVVTLKVFNSLGKEVAVLSEGFQNAGTYSVQFDASALTSGVYYYSIQAGDFHDVKKMLLVK